MDSLSNGEVSGKCLDKAILSSDDITESKSKGVTKEDLGGEAPNSEIPENNSISDPTKSETISANQKTVLLESALDSNPTDESNSESAKPSVAKENGISDPENLDKDESSSSSKDGIKTDESEKANEILSSTKSDNVAEIQEKSSSSNSVTVHDDKDNLEIILPSTKDLDKENSPNDKDDLETTLPSTKDLNKNSPNAKDDLETTLPSTKDLNKNSPNDKDDLETTLPSTKDLNKNSPNDKDDLESTLLSTATALNKENSPHDKSNLETKLPPDIEVLDKENSPDDKNGLKTASSKVLEKDKCPDVIDIVDTPNSPITSSNKCSNVNEVTSPTNAAEGECKLVTGTDLTVAKNHFMAGGSIVSSKDSEGDQQKLNSVHNSKVVDADQIMDFSKKILENCESTPDVNKSKNCEHIVNCTTSKNSKQSSEAKLVEPTKSVSENHKISDSSVNNQQDNDTNKPDPHEKLKEHLTSEIDEPKLKIVSNLAENHASNISITPSPDIQSSDSHLICDKENKSDDSLQCDERQNKELSDSFVFADLTNEETGFPEVFTGLVKIGKYISVKGDFTLRSSEALVESPSLIAPYLLKEPDSFPPKDKDSKSEVKDFFHSAAGEILIGIGLSRVNEWFHKDMVRIKKRQLKRNKTPELEEDLTMHEKFYSEAKKANSVYSFEFTECKTCGFTTESSVVMEGHLLVPHITQRREYQCNFCDIINRDPKGMLQHMQEVHRKIGRIQPPVLFFECPYCTFESNSKVKLNHHLLKCQRVYDQGVNQAPAKDFEFPALTPKPITVAVVKAYEKSLGTMHRGRGRPKKDFAEAMHVNKFPSSANLPLPGHPPFKGNSSSPLADSLMQNQLMSSGQMPNMLRPAHVGAMGQLRPGIPGMHMQAPNRFFGVNPNGQLVPLMGNNHLVTSSSQFPFSSNLDNSGGKKSSSSAPFYNKVFDISQRQPNSKAMSSVTITPLPKLTGPYPVPMAKPSTASGSNQMSSNSLVVCEICDGYIKDLEQLRTHMQLIHKVKIHPKMLVSRPPLNCQKCQWRFFTDQGLERHLLGAHGLVTSNMQELANKGKDAGCCTICGRVYASKLVSHMNQVHKITLKPAHLSYKCTVCSATFNLYRLFENHVYLVHSGAGKRSADGRSSPSKKLKALDGSPADDESLNHKEKKLSADIGDENAKKCKQCGIDMNKDKKPQSDMCEKCLKSDELVEGTVRAKTLKDELKETDKAIEKAVV